MATNSKYIDTRLHKTNQLNIHYQTEKHVDQNSAIEDNDKIENARWLPCCFA